MPHLGDELAFGRTIDLATVREHADTVAQALGLVDRELVRFRESIEPLSRLVVAIGRQCDGCEDGDDRDHDQQFDEGKTLSQHCEVSLTHIFLARMGKQSF